MVISFVKTIIFIFVTLMSLVSIATASDIKVDYNFFSKELTLYWTDAEADYEIKVNQVIYNDCVKQLEELATLTLQNYVEEYIIIENIDIGKYELVIYDVTTQILKGTKEIFIFLSSEGTELNWCVVDHEDPVEYNIYTKINPEDSYTIDNVVNVGNILTYNLNDLEPFSKKFLVITSDTGTIESDYSNEVIYFVALPSELKNVRLEF